MHPTNFLPQLSEVLGWTLLHSLWQGVLVLLLLRGLLYILRKQSTPQLRYLLLSSALLLMFGWVVLTFYQKAITVFGVPMGYSSSPSFGSIESFETSLTIENTSHWWSDMWWRADVFLRMYADQLAYFWLIGVLFFSIKWFGGFYFTYRLRRVGTIPVPVAWEQKVQQLSIQLGVRKSVSVVASVKVQVPLVVGHLKPVILLPFGMLSGLSPAQLEAILLHELAHVRRHDFLVNLMLSILEILLFYHPVFWLISNRILEERELCCDDIAVANCGNPRLYARTLLLMEEKRQQLTLAMSYQGKKQHLMDRIRRICLPAPSRSTSTSTKAGLALLLLLGMAVVSWAKLPAMEDPVLDPVIDALTIEVPQPNTAAAEQEAVASPLVLAETPAARQGAISAVLLQSTKQDTVPPRIPKMRTSPDLPSPPDFSSTSDKIASALKKKANDRDQLRAIINEYTGAISNWQSSVNAAYLAQWDDRRKEIEKAYEDWRRRVASKHGNDELAHALAFQNGTHAFEDELNGHEEAINASEQSLNEGLEDRIRVVEDLISKHEDQQSEHRDRMEYHRDRMSLHRLRMSVHSTRMDLHRERMNLHRDRMGIHRDRMDAHRTIMKAFKEEFFAELIKDGLMKDRDDDIEVTAKGEEVRVNGKALPSTQAQKYLKMFEKYGFEIKGEGQWRYHKDGNSQSFGTYEKRREE